MQVDYIIWLKKIMHNNINTSARQWVAFSLVIVQWFFITQTAPFSIRGWGYTWYYNLAISVSAFLFMKRKLVWSLLGKYRMIFLYYIWMD